MTNGRRVLETGSYARTRSDGRFVLEVPLGEWRIYTTHLGYRPDTTHLVVRRGETLAPRIILTASPLQLRSAAVQTRSR